MIELSESRIYEFEEFRLETKSHRLLRRETSELVPLTPKAVDLLIVLVQNGGAVLTKEELLDAIWGDSFVEEANLSQTIFVLRKALGDNSKEPRFILTAPNRGYQFIAPVREYNSEDKILEEGFLSDAARSSVSGTKAPSAKVNAQKSAGSTFLLLAVPLVLLAALGVYLLYPAAGPADLREIRSIAVLPFDDAGASTEEYLGVSLADALVNKFSGLQQITVRPTRTVAKYAGSGDDASKIGRELRVDAVLAGRIQRAGERVRVSVQLIRAADDRIIWTQNFDESFTNFFAVQDSISQKVVEALALRLDEKEREKFNRRGTENAQAYENFLRGRFFWNKRTSEGMQKAIENFQTAVELDPNYAQAYSALAETYVLVNLFGTKHDPEAFPQAKVAAETALRLDENLAGAHAALAQVKMQYDFDWAGTESEYQKAVGLNPNDATVRQWYGEFLALAGRTDESLIQLEKARELDPTSLSTNNALALPLIRAGKTDEALAVTAKVLEMDANFAWALHYRSRAFLLKGDLPNAVEFCRRALAASDQSILMKSNLAHVLARAGQETEARRILAELEKTARNVYVSPYNFAIIHNALGERAAVFKYLNQAVDEHDFMIPSIKGDTLFLNLHGDAQFEAVLRRVNL